VKQQPTNGKVRTIRIEPQPLLVRVCQHGIFLLVLFILIFSPLAFGAVRPWAQGPILLAVGLATLLWVIRILAAREVPAVLSPLGAPVLVLGTYVIIRYGLSEVEPVARPEALLGLGAVLFFFLVLNHVRHRWHITVLVWIWTILGTGLALYGISQVIAGSEWVWAFPQYDRYIGRASGTFIRPSQFAGYLQLVFPLAAANFLFSRRTFREKVGLFFACLVMSAAVLLSFSRGGWLGWFAALLVLAVYVVRRRGNKFRWAVIGGGALGIIVIAALIGIQSMREQPLGIGPETELYQLPQWRSAVEIGRRNPWLGSGPSMYKWLYPSLRTLQGQPDYASNEYLNLFADYGLIGCGLILWVTVAFVPAAIQILEVRAARYSAATPSNRYAFVVGSLAAFAAALVQASLDLNLHAPANGFTLAAIMAVVLTCGVHVRDADNEDVNRPGEYAALRMKGVNKLVLVTALLVAAALLAMRSRRSYPSYLSLRMAERANIQMDWPKAEKYYLRAAMLDKRNFEAATALGEFYSARATWNARERETLCDNALRWYERALTLNPYASDVLIKMARVYDVLGKRELAAERFDRAFQADPNNASYHAQRGLHYLRWGDRDKALTSFRRAYELGGSNPLPEIELKRLSKIES
jgi:putative inorganic carbon (HCO3(-)) transporter